MPAIVDLARLPKMPLEELRSLWKKHFGRSVPSLPRTLLIRELAWLAQERQEGGFDVRTRRLLQAAMRAATAESQRAESDGPAAAANASARKRPRKPNVSPVLPAAVRLVREWGGRQHEVIVVENGRAYRYRDRTYKSLTQVAGVITGAHRSGPGFFGLVSHGGKRKKPGKGSLTTKETPNE